MFSQMVCCCSKQIFKLCLIIFWRNIFQWYFVMFLFIERYGGLHFLEVVARKESVLRTRFFQLIKCIWYPSSILKRKKLGVKNKIVKIGQQMLKFPKISKVQICILSSSIFISSVKSIKLTSIIHNWNNLWMKYYISKLFWHTL